MKPKISVIIPSRNRSEQVFYCVSALMQQTLRPEKFEIIIVDDGSTDNTAERILSLQKMSPSHQIRQISIKRKDEKFRAAVARNIGAKKARGRILVFIDSDIISEPHMLENHLKHYSVNPNKVTVMGYRFNVIDKFHPIMFDLIKKKQLNKIKDIPLLFDIREPQESKFRLFEAKVGEEQIPWRHYHSHNISMTRQTYHRIGGFDETFVGWGDEDLELGYRLWKFGCRFYFDREIIGFHLDHSVNQKSAIISQFSNKRKAAQKHASLEIELFNDDTNATFWTEKEIHYFRYLQGQRYHPDKKGFDTVSVPKKLLDKAECVIGEGPELNKFKNLKYLINFRNGMARYIPKKAEHLRIIGCLNPLADRSVKTTVLYNYLDLLPTFYVVKVISEAIRTSKEVFIFQSNIEDFSTLIESFASSRVRVERYGGILREGIQYYKLSRKKDRKPSFPVNFLLSSFRELNENPVLLRIIKFLDMQGFAVSINSYNFDYRYGLETSSTLFKARAGFIYEKWWDHFKARDEEAINIHTNIDRRWRPGINVAIVGDSTRIAGDIKEISEEIRRNCDHVICFGRPPAMLKINAPMTLLCQRKPHGEEVWDSGIEFIYPIQNLNDRQIKNLHAWLESFIRLRKDHFFSRFYLLPAAEKKMTTPYLGIDFSSYKGGRTWKNICKTIDIYNRKKAFMARSFDAALKHIVKIYRTALNEPNRDIIEDASLMTIFSPKMLSASLMFIAPYSGPNLIKNKTNITPAEAFRAMTDRIAETTGNVSESFKDILNKTMSGTHKNKLLSRNLWTYLKNKDHTSFLLSFKKAKKTFPEFDDEVIKAVSLFISGKLKAAGQMFTKLLKDQRTGRHFMAQDIYNWAGRTFFLLGERKAAGEAFKKSLKQNPKNATALIYYNYLQKEKER